MARRIGQLELGPCVRHMGLIVERPVFKFHYGLIIASEGLQPFHKSSERRERLFLTAGVGVRGPSALGSRDGS